MRSYKISLLALLMTATAGTVHAEALSDAQIAAIVSASNKAEIDAGETAKSNSSDPAVKSFAEKMIAQHSDVDQEVRAWATSAKVKPQENAMSTGVKSKAAAINVKLKAMHGKDFDKSYVDGQIAMHKDVLQTIDKELMPNAKDANLKALLAKVRPSVEAHLQHAEDLRKKI